jgi:hypothetical protein
MYAALANWSDGYLSKIDFTTDTYGPIYRKLRKLALEFQDPIRGSPVRWTALMASYTSAMRSV